MKKKHQNFNLIEILISMVVIIFAMFIMVSFIPLAQNQTSKSVNMNQALNFSEHFISYIKSQEIDDVIETFPLAGEFNRTQDTNRSNYPSFKSSTGLDEWDQDGATHLYSESSDAKGLFKLVSYSTINNQKVKEAELEARIWISDIKMRSAYGSSVHSASLSSDHFDGLKDYKNEATDESQSPKSARVNIEFSWPINMPYEKRTKAFFFYDNMTNKYE